MYLIDLKLLLFDSHYQNQIIGVSAQDFLSVDLASNQDFDYALSENNKVIEKYLEIGDDEDVAFALYDGIFMGEDALDGVYGDDLNRASKRKEQLILEIEDDKNKLLGKYLSKLSQNFLAKQKLFMKKENN